MTTFYSIFYSIMLCALVVCPSQAQERGTAKLSEPKPKTQQGKAQASDGGRGKQRVPERAFSGGEY